MPELPREAIARRLIERPAWSWASIVAMVLHLAVAAAPAEAGPFTYQGVLRDVGGSAAAYDFQVFVHAAESGGVALSGPLPFDDVVLDEGRFVLDINPGPATFDGSARWLEFRIRRGTETGAFSALLPRQRIRSTPYAQHADDSNFAASVAPNSVTTLELADAAVGEASLQDAAVSNVKIAIDAVRGPQVQDGSLTAQDLADGAVTVAKLANGAVTSDKIGISAVGVAQIDTAQVQHRIGGANGFCLPNAAIRAVNEDGSVDCESIPNIASTWSLNGNTGTSSSSQFLGTTDAEPFEIRTRGSRSLRLEPSALASGGASVTANVIAGSRANAVANGVRGATIGGGGVPAFFTDPDVLFGNPNIVASHYGTVAGGSGNRAGGESEFVLGVAPFASVGGGVGNLAEGSYASIGGGFANRTNAVGANVTGGSTNVAWASASTVAGGSNNCAGGNLSFAAGYGAKVRPDSDPGIGGSCGALSSYANNGTGDQGTFAWADSAGPAFVTTGSNRFEVRATGGVRLVTGIDESGTPDAGVKLDADDNAWEVLSDRNAKAGLRVVVPEAVLAQLLRLPIYSWHYRRQPPHERHLGPMAQDFHALFGLNGDDDRHISTLDPNGVALAAIQGLHAHFEAQRDTDERRIAALEASQSELREELQALKRRLEFKDRE